MTPKLIGNSIRALLIGSTLGSTAAYFKPISDAVMTIKNNLFNFSILSNNVLLLVLISLILLAEWGITYFLVTYFLIIKEYPSSTLYMQGE